MKLIVVGLLGTVISAVFALTSAFVYSMPVMWLWNAVVPDVFGMKPLTWVQALWLSLLCALLFRVTSSEVTQER